MDRIGTEAARSVVLDLEGKPHPLETLWKERAAVVAFVRHFG